MTAVKISGVYTQGFQVSFNDVKSFINPWRKTLSVLYARPSGCFIDHILPRYYNINYIPIREKYLSIAIKANSPIARYLNIFNKCAKIVALNRSHCGSICL